MCLLEKQSRPSDSLLTLFVLIFFLCKQKQACMLLRNLVSRTNNYNQLILEMGAEALIAEALRTHRDCGDVGKAALRDLGCQVELKELWTGKHGSLTN